MNPISDSAATADEALQRLKTGNERFIAGTARFPTVQEKSSPT
jgi:carbonic anhydrase